MIYPLFIITSLIVIFYPVNSVSSPILPLFITENESLALYEEVGDRLSSFNVFDRSFTGVSYFI